MYNATIVLWSIKVLKFVEVSKQHLVSVFISVEDQVAYFLHNTTLQSLLFYTYF